VRKKAKVKVETYVMNSTFTETQRLLTEENWIAASMSYDTETIEILLSSAIDAVGANAPNRVLTRDLVGALPVSGTITNR
jgi:phage-related protein